MATMPLLNALDAVAHLLASEEPKRSVEDGRFYLRFLGLDKAHLHDDSDEGWKIVKERIDTVFGPDLLDWQVLQSIEQQHKNRRQSVVVRGATATIFGRGHNDDHQDQEAKFFALVALLSLYIAAVHDQNEQLWGMLTTRLTASEQGKIQMAFQFLLDNRRSITKAKLESLIIQGSPGRDSAFSTPYRPTSGSGSSSLGESFIHSPSSSSVSSPPGGPKSPLQDFFQAQATKQLVEKLQRELRETKTELDIEKSETTYLRAEVASIKDEKEALKHDLDETRGRLFASSNGKQSSVSMSEMQELQQRCANLQQKLSDVKDSNKYLKDLETQLEAKVGEHEELDEKYKSTLARLNEKTTTLSGLETNLTSLQLKLGMSEEEKAKLKETVDELSKQVQELQAINTFSRQSAIFNPGDPIGDISMDSPFSANVSLCQGETLGDAVVMNLQDEIAKLTQERDEMAKTIEEKTKSYDALSTNNSELRSELIAQNETLKTMEREAVEKEESLEALKAKLDGDLAERAQELKSQKEMFQVTQDKLEKMVAAVWEKDTAIERLQSHVSQIEQEKDTLAHKAKELQDELSDLDRKALEFEGEIEALAADNGLLQQKCESSQKLLDEKTVQMSNLEVTIKDFESKLEALTIEKAELSERHNSTKALLSEKASMVETLECNLAELRDRHETLAAKVQEKNDMMEALNAKVAHIECENERLQSQVSQIEQEKDTLASKTEELAAELKNHSQKTFAFESEKETLATENGVLQQKCESSQKLIDLKTVQMSNLEAIIKNSESKLEALTIEKAELIERHNSTKALLSEMTSKVEILEIDVAERRDHLLEFQEEIQKKCELIDALNARVAYAESEMLNCGLNEDKLADELNSVIEDKEHLERELKAKAVDHKKLEEAYNLVETRLAEETAKLARLKANFELGMSEACEDSRQKIDQLQAQISIHIQREDDLVAELKNLREKSGKELLSSNALLEEASAKLEEKNKALDQITEATREKDESIEVLKAKLTQLETERKSHAYWEERLERELKEQRHVYEAKMKGVESQLEAKISETLDLSSKYQLSQCMLNEKTADFEAKLATLETMTKEDKRSLEMLREENLKINALEANLQVISKEKGMLQEMYTSAKSDLDEKTASIGGLEAAFNALKRQVESSEDENAKLRSKFDTQSAGMENLVKSVEEKEQLIQTLNAQLNNGGASFEEKLQSELKAQKQRYEAKIKDIHATLTSKYKVKVEECINKWQDDIAAKEKLKVEVKSLEEFRESSKKYEDRYNLAKKKLEEVVRKMEELSNEAREKAKKQDAEIAKLTRTIYLLENKIRELEQRPTSDKLFQENQQFQLELKKLRAETRSLEAQNRFADAKIRELQKASSTSALKSEEKREDVFKMPSMKNTPGRTRATRTQSEVAMARRPPQGSGSIFLMDEEAGEMFSSSYLSDLKDGVCSVDDTGRISELARRNTMQPAHLKSSYPCETQFRPANEFTDDDLRNGKIQMLAEATANLSVDSPALNTRRQSSIRMNIGKKEKSPVTVRPRKIETPPQPSGLRPRKETPEPQLRPPRKRPSMSSVDVENCDVIKRARKELSYSKPGPPTPARKHNRSNTSLNSSMKSTASNQSVLTAAFETPAKAHDKTPLLDSTNKSNRSLRSLKTPMSLKKVMTRAFRSRNKYSVKKGLVETPQKHS